MPGLAASTGSVLQAKQGRESESRNLIALEINWRSPKIDEFELKIEASWSYSVITRIISRYHTLTYSMVREQCMDTQQIFLVAATQGPQFREYLSTKLQEVFLYVLLS